MKTSLHSRVETMKRKKNNETSDQDNVPDSPTSEWLIDSDVLDCDICFDPMTLPVFQCENGHTCCSSCFFKVRSKCPPCSLPIGNIRCRAIERVLESATKACKNQVLGCRETVSYINRKEHEKVCKYKPCMCPFPDCCFVSSYERLTAHSSAQHPTSAIRFRFETPFEVTMKPSANLLVLQEEAGTEMFTLHRRNERVGTPLWVSCVSPDSSEERWYRVWISGKGRRYTLHTLRMVTRGEAGDGDGLPTEGVVVLSYEFCQQSSGDLAFNITIT